MAYESWESEEALEGHKASAHYAVYKSSYEPLSISRVMSLIVSINIPMS